VALGRLSNLQERVLVALAGIEPPWTLSGGAALAGFHTAHRETRDLDLFWQRSRELGDRTLPKQSTGTTSSPRGISRVRPFFGEPTCPRLIARFTTSRPPTRSTSSHRSAISPRAVEPSRILRKRAVLEGLFP
jgi:hypothetical protein